MTINQAEAIAQQGVEPVLYETVQLGHSRIQIEKPRQDMLLQDSGLPTLLPEGQVESLMVARESGPCGGVKASIYGTYGAQEAYGTPVSVKINAKPTNGADSNAMFDAAGVLFDVEPADLVSGDTYLISAHGNPRQLAEARDRQDVRVFDSTCIFVEKTHEEIRRAARKAEEDGIVTGIVYLSIDGRPDHSEFIGSTQLIEDEGLPYIAVHSREDIAPLVDANNPDYPAHWQRIRIVSQTTNNAEEAIRTAQEIVALLAEARPEIDTDTFPFNEHDICRTVTDRQNATRLMVRAGVETIIVVGSVNSKNTKSLVRVAIDEAEKKAEAGEEAALKRVILVNSCGQLPTDIKGSVGVVSGASTLDRNVSSIIEVMNYTGNIEEIGESDKDRKAMDVFRPIHARTSESQAELARMVAQVAASQIV